MIKAFLKGFVHFESFSRALKLFKSSVQLFNSILNSLIHTFDEITQNFSYAFLVISLIFLNLFLASEHSHKKVQKYLLKRLLVKTLPEIASTKISCLMICSNFSKKFFIVLFCSVKNSSGMFSLQICFLEEVYSSLPLMRNLASFSFFVLRLFLITFKLLNFN